jgi:hypothetical protein
VATKTYENLVTEARKLLQDTDTNLQRYTDETLIEILNRGLRDLGTMRPDVFYDLFAANSLNVPEIVESGAGAGQIDWTDVFTLEFQFYTPLVGYIVGIAEIFDDEYTADGRAALLLNQFRNQVIGL